MYYTLINFTFPKEANLSGNRIKNTYSHLHFYFNKMFKKVFTLEIKMTVKKQLIVLNDGKNICKTFNIVLRIMSGYCDAKITGRFVSCTRSARILIKSHLIKMKHC